MQVLWFGAVLLGFRGAHAQQAATLPDAPRPSAVITDGAIQVAPGHADPGKGSTIRTAPLERRKWSRYVDPGEHVPQLSTREKMMFWMHDEVQWYAPVPAFISAGFGQIDNGDPKYGVDSGAFGERLGTAFIRQASMRFLCDSLVPTLTHEDPRYYRKASGSYGSRGLWAASRALVTRRSGHRHVLNNSDLWGHLAASVLTQAYYPQSSLRAGIVFSTWLTSIAGQAGNNEFFEFWPDAANAWKGHRERVRARSSGYRGSSSIEGKLPVQTVQRTRRTTRRTSGEHGL